MSNNFENVNEGSSSRRIQFDKLGRRDRTSPNIAILPSQESGKWFGFRPRVEIPGICFKNPEVMLSGEVVDPCETGVCSENANCLVNKNENLVSILSKLNSFNLSLVWFRLSRG